MANPSGSYSSASGNAEFKSCHHIPRAAPVNGTLALPQEGDKPFIYHSDTSGELKKTQIESIKSAQQSILVMTFTLSDTEIIRALNERAEAGVDVTVIIDRNHMQTIQTLGSNKIKLLTRPSGEGHYHHKVLVLDQALTWLGSANFSPDALTKQANMMTLVHNKELATYLHREVDVMQGVRKERAISRQSSM